MIMRRSKVSSQGQGGGAGKGSVPSPTSTTPGGKKTSKVKKIRGGGIFGKGVVLMVRRGGSYGHLVWFGLFLWLVGLT